MGKLTLLLLFLLAVPLSLNGQQLSPDYTDADRRWLDQLLYRGVEWQPRAARVTGHEFFLTDSYIGGEVTIDGITFKNLKIRYDIWNEKLIIMWRDIHAIVLDNDVVDAFSLGYGGTVRNFINLHDKFEGISGFSEVIYSGNSMVVARYTKVIGKNTSLTTYAQFRENDRYYFISGTECRQIRSRASFLKMLGDYKTEVKRYIRQNQLVVSTMSPEGFGLAAARYDSLINRSEEGD
jgi:hypothetical protein